MTVAALGAPSAFAQAPTYKGYDETGVVGAIEEGTPAPAPAPAPAAEVKSESGSKSEPAAAPAAEAKPAAPAEAADRGGSLPFTGLELGVMVLMGAALLGTGFALRRVARGATVQG